MTVTFMSHFLMWAHKQASKKWEFLFLTTIIPFGFFVVGFLLWPHYDLSSVFMYSIPLTSFVAGLFISANLGPKAPLTFLSLGFVTALCQGAILKIFYGDFMHWRIFAFIFATTMLFNYLGVAVTAVMRFLVLNVSSEDFETSQVFKLLGQVIPPVLTALIVYFFTGQIP